MLSVPVPHIVEKGTQDDQVHPSRVQVDFQSHKGTARDRGRPYPGQFLGIRLSAFTEQDNDQRIGRAVAGAAAEGMQMRYRVSCHCLCPLPARQKRPNRL